MDHFLACHTFKPLPIFIYGIRHREDIFFSSTRFICSIGINFLGSYFISCQSASRTEKIPVIISPYLSPNARLRNFNVFKIDEKHLNLKLLIQQNYDIVSVRVGLLTEYSMNSNLTTVTKSQMKRYVRRCSKLNKTKLCYKKTCRPHSILCSKNLQNTVV